MEHVNSFGLIIYALGAVSGAFLFLAILDALYGWISALWWRFIFETERPPKPHMTRHRSAGGRWEPVGKPAGRVVRRIPRRAE